MTTRRPALTGVTYRKSSYSGGHNNCVEVAQLDQSKSVAIRDSKRRGEGAHVVSHRSWRTFIGYLKLSE